jgi:flavin-binding protein dodecin
LDIKRSDSRSLIYGRTIGDKFLVLCVVFQIHVRSEQAIHQFSFLFLTTYAGDGSHQQYKDGYRCSHMSRLPELRGACKANLLPSRRAEPPDCLSRQDSRATIARLFIVFHCQLPNNDRMPDHVYKKIEIVGSSANGFEEAVQNALARAEKTVRNMRWFEVTETRGCIEDGKVGEWQVTLKIGFTLNE